MNAELLVEKHPTLFHMAEAGTWNSIRRYGLLSTKALLDHLGANERERESIISRHRANTVNHRDSSIRDQKPMNHNLAKCLPPEITCQQWFEYLNGKVFFWTSADRLLTFRKAYKLQRQLIIEVPTQLLMERHGGRITLCHINSGATRMPNHYRDYGSFNTIEDFPYSSK